MTISSIESLKKYIRRYRLGLCLSLLSQSYGKSIKATSYPRYAHKHKKSQGISIASGISFNNRFRKTKTI